MNLDSIWAWLSAHAILILLAWPIITALVNLAFGAADKWALTHPKFAAVLGIIESAGLDARSTIAWLAKLLAGKTGVVVKGSGPAAMLVFIGVSCCVVANTTACKDPSVPQTVIVDMTPAAACIAGALADGGVSDPMVVVAECAGTTIADVVKVIADLLDNAPKSDAGLGFGDPRLSSHERYLREMLAKAKAHQ